MPRIKYELRPYQQDWIEDIFSSWSRGNRRVLGQMACGAGKTVCFAYISNYFLQREQRVLAIAHRIELIEQAANKFREITGVDVGIIKGKTKLNLEAPIQVASIQTLAQRKHLPYNIGLVVIDECHHASASTYRQVIEHYSQAKILGVTATPERIDGQGFEELFEDMIVGYPTEKLIQEGYLSRFRLFATDQTISTKGIEKSDGDFNSKDLALTVTNQLSVEDIYKNYCQLVKDKTTIIYAASIAHSKEITKYFTENDIKAEHIDGDTSPKERFNILERFQSGATKVLTNYEILLEGYDYHDVECVFCVRPTASPMLWLQMTGRALRISSSKSFATIIDVTENWKQHGLPDDARKWSLSASSMLSQYRGLIKCENCTHIFRPLYHELHPMYVEVDDNGLLIKHYETYCPSCAASIHFTTKERSETYERVKVRLKPGLSPLITEINLEVNSEIIQKVYIFVKTTNGSPEDIYKGIYRKFIEIVEKFTLGDWRRIVKIVEPNELVPTKKAWELYQDGLLKHKNRLAALAAIEQRQKREKIKADSLRKELGSPPQPSKVIEVVKKPANVGNPDVKRQYNNQWILALSRCMDSTKDFLSNHAGLFHVEFIGYGVNISIELENVPDLKDKLKDIRDSELQDAFGAIFAKKANIMFRLSK